MRNDYSLRLASRGAALGLVAGLLLASGSAATFAEEAEKAATGATAATSSNPRPDCANDASVLAAQYLKKGSGGLRPNTVKCKGTNTIGPPLQIGDYDGVCNNAQKCSTTHPDDKIEVKTELSKSELGVSADEPVVEVISVVIVQVGDATCYQYCTGSGGSKSCEKICD